MVGYAADHEEEVEVSLRTIQQRRDSVVLLGPKVVAPTLYEACVRSQALERELEGIYALLGQAFSVGTEADSAPDPGAETSKEPEREAPVPKPPLRELLAQFRDQLVLAPKPKRVLQLIPHQGAISLGDLARLLHGDPVDTRKKTATRKIADQLIWHELVVRDDTARSRGTSYRRTARGQAFDSPLSPNPLAPSSNSGDSHEEPQPGSARP